jgi:hypothetical protein
LTNCFSTHFISARSFACRVTGFGDQAVDHLVAVAQRELLRPDQIAQPGGQTPEVVRGAARSSSCSDRARLRCRDGRCRCRRRGCVCREHQKTNGVLGVLRICRRASGSMVSHGKEDDGALGDVLRAS